jgi:hypothetical protein
MSKSPIITKAAGIKAASTRNRVTTYPGEVLAE